MITVRWASLVLLFLSCGPPPTLGRAALLWTFNGRTCADADVSEVSFVRDGIAERVACRAQARDGLVFTAHQRTLLRDFSAVDSAGIAYEGPRTLELFGVASDELEEHAVHFGNESWWYRVTVESERTCDVRWVSIDGDRRQVVPCTGAFDAMLGMGKHDLGFHIGSGCCVAGEDFHVRTTGEKLTVDGQYTRVTLEPVRRATW